jgi:hypothetical protein
LGSDFRPFVGQFLDLVFRWGFENVSKNQKAYYERTNNVMQALYGFFVYLRIREVMGQSWLIQDKELLLFWRTHYQGFILFT